MHTSYSEKIHEHHAIKHPVGMKIKKSGHKMKCIILSVKQNYWSATQERKASHWGITLGRSKYHFCYDFTKKGQAILPLAGISINKEGIRSQPRTGNSQEALEYTKHSQIVQDTNFALKHFRNEQKESQGCYKLSLRVHGGQVRYQMFQKGQSAYFWKWRKNPQS